MAVSTTQSIWRSGGGDQTRTAYCGSGVMAATFYVANAAAASTTKVTVSSTNNANVILPAGAVITSVSVASANAAATKTFDMGFTLYTSGTTSGAGLINEGNANVATFTTVGSATNVGVGSVMSSSQMVYITAGAGANTPGNGTVLSGIITYYVQDPLGGQQNV